MPVCPLKRKPGGHLLPNQLLEDLCLMAGSTAVRDSEVKVVDGAAILVIEILLILEMLIKTPLSLFPCSRLIAPKAVREVRAHLGVSLEVVLTLVVFPVQQVEFPQRFEQRLPSVFARAYA